MAFAFLPGAAAGQADPGEIAGSIGEGQPSHADDLRSRRLHFTIVEENDVGFFTVSPDHDEYYSQGAMFAGSVEAPELLEDLPGLGSGFRLGAGAFTEVAVGIQARQLIFTPVDIESFEPIEDDRPFAGVLLLGGHVQRRNDVVLDHAEFLVGAVGPVSGAENAQSQLHQAFSFATPNGWENQVEDRFLFQLNVRRDVRRRRPLGESHAWAWDVVGSVGQDLGNFQIQTHAGVTVRIGRNLPDDWGPSRIGALGAQVQDRFEDWGFSGFVRAGGRVVAMDITLEGHGDEGVPSVTRRPLVGELAYGIEWRPVRWFTFTWQDIHRSESFVEQRGQHRFASFSLVFSLEH